MNEELMKELVSILRAMKDGTPDAWGVLVEQKSIYCFTVGFSLLFVAVLCAFLARPLLIAGFREASKDILEQKDGALFGGVIGGITLAIGFCVCLGLSIPYIAEGFAPLGRVLEVLR